jgi:hypothetical protein
MKKPQRFGGRIDSFRTGFGAFPSFLHCAKTKGLSSSLLIQLSQVFRNKLKETSKWHVSGIRDNGSCGII